MKLAGRLADELNAAGILGQSVTEQAINFGPNVTETSRVRPIITALKDKIEHNAQIYHDFRGILQSLGADADTALHYMPKEGKLILAHWHQYSVSHTSCTLITCTDSPFNTTEAVTPSPNQG